APGGAGRTGAALSRRGCSARAPDGPRRAGTRRPRFRGTLARHLPAVRGMVPRMARNPFSLEGKTAIITGGGTGIGKSIAIEFARAGADVALCSRKLEHLEPVVKTIEPMGRRPFADRAHLRVH